jgi:hypothetical protein
LFRRQIGGDAQASSSAGITVDLEVVNMRAEYSSHIVLSDKRVDGQAFFDGRLFLRVARRSFQCKRRAGSHFVALLHYDAKQMLFLCSHKLVHTIQMAREAPSRTS